MSKTTPPGALRITVASLLLLTAPLAAQPPAEDDSPSLSFRDVTDRTGITFEHNSAPEKKYILESMSGGVALFDYDNDDDLDVYFLNSLTVDTATEPKSARSALYRNRGDGTFEDVSDEAGVAYPGWGMGLCVADVDGDGWLDFYVTAVGTNRLYRNRGDSTFEEVAEKLGVAGGGWSTGCGFADYDRDGRLDLFVSRYVEVEMDGLPKFGEGKSCQYRGIAVQCGPRGLPGTGDLLFHNLGESFEEVSEAAGVNDPDRHFGLGVAWFDFDDDGWLDLYVANDANSNFLYVNQKDGTFAETAFPMGVAVSEDGAEQGGMGVALGDIHNEGREALFVTNFAAEYNALYRNAGDYFVDESFRSRTAPSSLPYVGWGTAFVDFDHDGWLDLVIANGHVYPQLDDAKLGASAPYRQRKLVYRGLGKGSFEEIAESHGGALTEARVSRGLAAGDLDGDGRVDLVVHDLDGRPQVLRNESTAGSWLIIELVGKGANRNAIGAKIEVAFGSQKQARTVRSGTSYLSQNDLAAHFGLGDAKTVTVRVRWPDGTSSEHAGIEANQRLTLEQP